MRPSALLCLALAGCGADHLVGREPPACSSGPTPGFAVRESDGGPNPDAVAAAFLDGDRELDLVVANTYQGTVTALLGQGGGAFGAQAPQAAGPGRGFFSLDLGDADGDGRIDILVANGAGLLLLGQGDGSFVAGPAWGAAPTAVAVADLDGDRRLDLAALDSGLGTLHVLLGAGDGTFRETTVVSTGSGPRAVLPADLDGDGVLDLAVANFSAHSVSVFLGRGQGMLGTRQDVELDDQPYALASGDLDGDGIRDLVASCWKDVGATGRTSDTARVLRGLGGGRFLRAEDLSTGGAPTGVAIADLDGDGRLDVATADLAGNSVSLFAGQGGGRFAASSPLAGGCSPSSLLVTDVDRDGRPDVVVTSWSVHKVRVLLRLP